MSNPRIFADNAQAYFDRGIPVIPLHRGEKRPIPQGWNEFAHRMPSKEEQIEWKMQYADGNIGLVLGPQSGVSVMDIDTDDPSLLTLITECLPTTPWIRIGKKGMVLAFRYSGIKTFRIKTQDGKSICEFLSDRTQVVLPPSIHPETQRPYTANSDLLDVIDKLPTCPSDLEAQLRAKLESAKLTLSKSGWSRVTEFVAAGMRDTSLTEKAGLFAYAVLRGERTLKEAIGMLRSYNEEFVQNVAGDPVDVEKHVTNLIRFIQRDLNEKKRMLPTNWADGFTLEELTAMGCNFDAGQRQIPQDEAMLVLKEAFEKDDGKGGPESLRVIEEVLGRIAQTPSMNELEKERIFQYIAKSSGTGLTVANLRRHLRTLMTATATVGVNHSELARALMSDIEQLHPVRFSVGQFWKWNGAYWEPLETGWMMTMLSTNYGHTQAARKFGDLSGILKLMQSLVPQGLPVMAGSLLTVNFANGVLVMDPSGVMRLEDHQPEFGMTYVLPFRYLPSGTVGAPGDVGYLRRLAPMFCQFLEDSWGQDPDYKQKVLALQEMMAVTLFGQGSAWQRAFLLHGVPKSGKSQLLKIVEALVPDAAKSAVNPADWADKFAPALMYKKLLNIAGELSDKRKIDGQRFKDIIDGSSISGQYKFQDAFRFQVTCTHWFASNHFPRTEDTSDGFTRRWLIMDFRRPVPEADRKVNLGDEIVAAEQEAIAAWALEGMPRLLENREYTLPASHREIVSEMANLNNVVRAFVAGCRDIVVGEGGEMDEMGVYQAFWGFNLEVTQMRAMSVPEFRAKMRELAGGYRFEVLTKEDGRTVYMGIKKGKR